MSGERQPIDTEQGKAWIAEGERAARTGAPIDSNPYDGREEQVPRLLWLRGYLCSAPGAKPGPKPAGQRPPEPRWT
ncbi:MAG: hypothetical protein JWO79_297 [Actinomycetia bacterium]|jgi:hypothetical protein|nr:hypothetical protein [Actinomycetes bacterium]MDQ1653176.1 hypothetical protein [Cryptosporangiaceae bacterium]MDQ1656519.1 hypothetical protein [Cryptosporangiaceae bacterium]